MNTGVRHGSHRLLRVALLLGLAGFVPHSPVLRAETPAMYQTGARLPTLTVGATTYHDVVVRSISAQTVLFMHRGGMASVRLRDLSPGEQVRFGYDPAEERASDAAAVQARQEREARQAAAVRARQLEAEHRSRSRFESVLHAFGRPAGINPEGVDLRPRFRELGLYAKDQGRRPSCAVFAVVSAVEYLHAENTGQAEKFSEEYLVWATYRSISRPDDFQELTGDDADTGFALSEVVTALRSYGIPAERSLPNTMGRSLDGVSAPSPEVIREARAHTQGSVHFVPGRDNVTRLNNIVHALNAGLPVPIGAGWPQFHNMRAALLNSQPPAYSHAVTLVGYRNDTGRIEDTTFIFKNSWGPAWGANGYGFATYAYLLQHLHSAILLEIGFRD